MRVACLCPTYMRPVCTANAAAMFLEQTHPDRRLYILDDGNTFDGTVTENKDLIRLKVVKERFPSLPAKYNHLLDWAKEDYSPDLIMVWENDDLFLPNHISNYVAVFAADSKLLAARQQHVFVYHPSDKKVVVYPVNHNFHGSLAFRPRMDSYEPRWIETDEAGFDLLFMDELQRRGITVKVGGLPTYVFRYPCTETENGERFAVNVQDTTWYKRYGVNYSSTCCNRPQIPLIPKKDDETTCFEDSFWANGLLQHIFINYSKTGHNLMGPGWLPG